MKLMSDCFIRTALLFSGSWIITSGLSTGVVKHVGKGIREFSLANQDSEGIVCIGIAPWGLVANREVLCRDGQV